MHLLKTMAALLITSVVSACASVAPERMILDDVAASTIQIPVSIEVRVSGGRDPTFGYQETVSDEEFSVPLIAALNQFNLFQSITDNSPDLTLNADIGGQGQSADGLTYTGELGVNYEIVDKVTGEAIWTESILAEHPVTFGDAFSGAKRTTIAREGVVRKNIFTLIELLRASSLRAANEPASVAYFLDVPPKIELNANNTVSDDDRNSATEVSGPICSSAIPKVGGVFGTHTATCTEADDALRADHESNVEVAKERYANSGAANGMLIVRTLQDNVLISFTGAM